MQEEDLSWLTEEVRARGLETLKALFGTSHISLVTFDLNGLLLGINAHTIPFAGQEPQRYQGLNLLEHPVLRRLGWSALAARTLAGENVEVTDSRWVTLFSGEERYVDVALAPVMVAGKIVGGAGCLVDATAKHRALARENALRREMQELVLYLTRDLAHPLEGLASWAASHPEHGMLGDQVKHLATLLADLRAFLEVGGAPLRRAKVSLSEALLAAGSADRVGGQVSVYGDARVLRRALSNVVQFASRSGGGRYQVTARDGHVTVAFDVGGSASLLQALLGASSLSAAEAAGADASLAAARWMMELMGGTLTAGEHKLLLELPLADASVLDF